MSVPVTVLIVDDHPLYRQGLRQVLEADARFLVLAEAGTGTQAMQMLAQYAPQLVVLDVGLPDVTGLEIAEELKRRAAAGVAVPRVVMLTMLKDELAFNKAMSLGVMGYVLKENAVSEITSCMAAVAQGQVYISPSMSGFLLKRHERTRQLAAHRPGLDDLTVAERRILKRIADKKTTKDIAAELCISPRTVETHRANICTKLELKGANSLLQFALEHRDLLAALH